MPPVGASGLPFTSTLPPENLPNKADQDKYELLCLNNARKPVDAFKNCHLARIPSHAVVARSVNGKEDLIWELLQKAQVSIPPPPHPPTPSPPAWIRCGEIPSFPNLLLLQKSLCSLSAQKLRNSVNFLTRLCSGQQKQ